jgi:hypothetical protein
VTRRAPPAAPALLALAGALATVGAGCNSGFAPQYRVSDLRVMAVRAQVQGRPGVADPSPGDTVALDALVANPLGLTGLTADWYACIPTTTQAASPCVDPTVLSDPSRFDGNPAVLHLPSGTPATVTSFTIPATQAITDGTQYWLDNAVTKKQYCGLYAPLEVVLVVRAEGRQQVALKHLRLWPTAAQLAAKGVPGVDDHDRNTNPGVADAIRAPGDRSACTGGTPLGDPYPAGETVLCGRYDETLIDTYRTCDASGITGSEQETIDWQWYVTGGEFPKVGGIGNATDRDVDFTRPPGAFSLWLIARDGRGGVDWRLWSLGAAP